MATVPRNRKRERLEARVTPDQKALFQRAADLTGRSLTDFIVSSLQAAAEEAIRAHHVVELSVRDMAALLTAIENPPAPNEEVLAAAREYRTFTGR
ncbi:MAG: DUF1778 domain-containing protein [Chloroflexi bacterium]|nr:DUF1778 domain-containing protein [Chloroflexota bacterium]